MNNKSGFTLSEVLIALGIVGILAAVLIPAFDNSRPDKNKIMYLKAYNSLSEVIITLVHDSNYFSSLYTIETAQTQTTSEKNEDLASPPNSYHYTQNTTYYDSSFNIERYPLLDYTAPRLSEFNNETYSGKNKLCELLKSSLNGKAAYACGTSGEFDTSYNFTTKVGGMRWKVEPSPSSLDDIDTNGTGSINYYNLVTVDVNGSNAPNSDTANGKTTPDRFKFYILANGKIVPADVYGQAYIANSVSVSKKIPNISDYTEKTTKNIDGITLSVGIGRDIQSLQDANKGAETKEWDAVVDINKEFSGDISDKDTAANQTYEKENVK